jgi:hypothetical protein
MASSRTEPAAFLLEALSQPSMLPRASLSVFNKTNSVALVRERAIPIERQPLVGEVSAKRLSGLVVRILGYRSRGSGSIPGSTRFSEK